MYDERVNLIIRYLIKRDRYCENAPNITTDVRKMYQQLKSMGTSDNTTVHDTAKRPFDINKAIEKHLRELGVPANLSGYTAWVHAVAMTIEDPSYLCSMTKRLYPGVALRVSKTATQVERSMRHAIETSFYRCDSCVLQEYFSNTIDMRKGKVTNGEFLARLAEIVKSDKEDYENA